MRYINLNLKADNNKDNENYIFDGVIDKHEVIVLLGSPGSGKTSILKKYNNEHKNISHYTKVKEFIKLDTALNNNIQVFLLDGLDEYRSVAIDKAFIITELGNKIKDLNNIKIVISCREMDWYGETDQEALKSQIQKDAALYTILPLNHDQKNKLATLLNIDDAEQFIYNFDRSGFLENPQMFYMLAKIYKENPEEIISSKKNLYRTFIKNAREKKKENIINKVNVLEEKEILKYTGYLAFYYIFSGVDEYSDKNLDGIMNKENSYSRDNLERVLNTNLFSEKRFIHRTIAEFALANFINEHKLEKGKLLSLERIKNLFIKGNRVPTDLRGTYAWLCSMTEEKELIKVDPYYQAIHGDNSLFNSDLKKEITLQIKKYAQTNPYFYNFYHKMDIEGFYDPVLDNFFMKEFIEATELKNHYIYFITNAICSSDKISDTIKEFLKKQILNNEINKYVKTDIIVGLKNDIQFLKEILTNIKEGKIEDNSDTIKDRVLTLLYPDIITPDQVIEYLKLYKEEVIGHCYYLFDTPYEKQYQLVDDIHKTFFDEERQPHLQLPGNLKSFIEEYLAETITKYDKDYSAEQIYNILKHFKEYYEKDVGIDIKTYRFRIKDKLEYNYKKVAELANKIFSIYIDDLLRLNTPPLKLFSSRYDFSHFFNLKTPDSPDKIIFSKITPELGHETNKNLFQTGLAYSPRDSENKIIINDQIRKIAKEFSLEDTLEEYLNPPKQEWEIEHERIERKREEERQKVIDDNEDYFKNKTDEEIEKNFSDLYKLAKMILSNDDSERTQRYVTKETFNRLKFILKEAVYNELFDPELLTIESLAMLDSPDARRNIDIMYYVSSVLNDGSEVIKIKEEKGEFLKYLYINNMLRSNVINIIKGNLVDILEKNEPGFVKELLKKYIEYLLESHLKKLKGIILNYILKEEQIDHLKIIAQSYASNLGSTQDSIIKNFLNVYNFTIKLNELKQFEKIPLNVDNTNIITALTTLIQNNKDNFTINMVIALHSLFSYHNERFMRLDSGTKIKIVDYMMSVFNTKESIEYVDGFQSDKDQCASFLRQNALSLLNGKELKTLIEFHKDEGDIWYYVILNKISELDQVYSDQEHSPFSIKNIKEFIFLDSILSQKDFFIEIYLRLNNLKEIIEGNRGREKNFFYNNPTNRNGKKSFKHEEECRDIIISHLKLKYEDDIILSEEKHEGENRVDINVKYVKNPNFEVQVECKKDVNREIYTGIPDQLIDKYLSKKLEYGIYLIFYFGKENKTELLTKVEASIPEDYKEKIRIVCIDLR